MALRASGMSGEVGGHVGSSSEGYILPTLAHVVMNRLYRVSGRWISGVGAALTSGCRWAQPAFLPHRSLSASLITLLRIFHHACHRVAINHPKASSRRNFAGWWTFISYEQGWTAWCRHRSLLQSGSDPVET